MDNILLQVHKTLIESDSIVLNNLKLDLKSINIDGYFLRLSYNSKTYMCTFTLQATDISKDVYMTQQSALMKASALSNVLEKILDELNSKNSKYAQITSLIRNNKKADCANFTPSYNKGNDTVTTQSYYPKLISTFTYFIDLGDKHNE